jgi:hypothetical protein
VSLALGGATPLVTAIFENSPVTEPDGAPFRLRNMMRRTVTALLVVAASTTLGACGKADQVVQQSGLPTAPVVLNGTQPFASGRPISVSHDGRFLSVKAVGGGCQTPSLSAREGTGTVTVTIKVVTRQKPGEGCAANAELVPVQATLARPLDGRKLIDGSTGRSVPAS